MSEVTMESRKCQCGCDQSFRVISSSGQRFASQDCEAKLTPGGLRAVQEASKRRRGVFREIPAEATGQATSMELAKLLGTTYQTVFNLVKSERITPIPSESRNKVFDLAVVRKQLGGNSRHREDVRATAVKQDASGYTKTQHTPERVELAPPSHQNIIPIVPLGTDAAEFAAIERRAKRKALKAFRRELLKASEAAERGGRTTIQLLCLKRFAVTESIVA